MMIDRLKDQIKILTDKIVQMKKFYPENVTTLNVIIDKNGNKIRSKVKTYEQLRDEREEGLELITRLTLKLHELEKRKRIADTERNELQQQLSECRDQLTKMSNRISNR